MFAVRVGEQGGDLGDGRGRFGLVVLFVVPIATTDRPIDRRYSLGLALHHGRE